MVEVIQQLKLNNFPAKLAQLEQAAAKLLPTETCPPNAWLPPKVSVCSAPLVLCGVQACDKH
jgi:hypothetical protein